ncbi:MAG: TlpA disulfide reductase family protein [Gemmataceae bacterium]
MNRIVTIVTATTMMGASLALAQPPAAKPESVADRLKDLSEQYASKFKAVMTVAQAARTPEARQRVLDEEIPRLQVFGAKAVELAKSAPADPVSLEAVAWTFENGFKLDAPAAESAVKIVLDHHLGGDAYLLAQVCAGLESYKGPGTAAERGLRGVMDKCKHREVQGFAAYFLASRLRGQADSGGDAKDAVALYERVVRDFSDLKVDQNTTLDVYAKRGLFELNNLMVGKTAPEPPAGSVDLAGKPARLLDYRGKVVVLDFWRVDCLPCRKLIPHEKALVTKYAGRPFTFIGVNADVERAEAEQFLKDQPLPWVQWWGGPEGGMARTWNMSPFPTMLVLDANGVIRMKFRGGEFKPDDIDAAVEKLVREAEAKK